ncbi:MAG: hypothetical protein Q9227_003850 [Pyrenula ochraceoflavens]
MAFTAQNPNLKRNVQAAFDDPEDQFKSVRSHGDDPNKPSSNYQSKVRVREKYHIVGFISSGTYGRVYKAVGKNGTDAANKQIGANEQKGVYAIKKFKPDKEDTHITYTGLSQSAIREMALCTELSHANVIHLVEIILEEKCIFMVFEYCEHDLLQIIHHHTQPTRHAIPARMIKSILFQLLNGLLYLHRNWVLHRDLKPANIMVTSSGAVRIGDLGLARLFRAPLQILFHGDKVVVTIWYRAPDLLLGARHYTPAIDLWAVGCIFAELLALRPIFKGEEAKMDSKKTVPFQRNQMSKIVEIMGLPRREDWPGLVDLPEFPQLQTLSSVARNYAPPPPPPPTSRNPHSHHQQHHHHDSTTSSSSPSVNPGLESWYTSILRGASYPSSPSPHTPGPSGLALLTALLTWDPAQRLTAAQALEHEYFTADDSVDRSNCFEGLEETYPSRRVSSDDNDIRTASLPGTKRSGLPDDSLVGGAAKRR